MKEAETTSAFYEIGLFLIQIRLFEVKEEKTTSAFYEIGLLFDSDTAIRLRNFLESVTSFLLMERELNLMTGTS